MKKTTPLDPVTRYATDVVAGKVIASRLVRLACARHLNDLQQAKKKGLLWKPADAQEAIDFFEQVLHLPEETDVDEDVEADVDVSPERGTPFMLSAHQMFIVGSLFGWYAIRVSPKTGARRVQQRFRIAFYQAGKGDGKTPLFAGCLLYMLIRHGVRGAQLFCAAVTLEQARIAIADCLKMVEASPALKALVTVTGNNISILKTGSFIRAISAERRGLDGKRVQGAVVDELHEHPSSVVAVKIRKGIKGRPNALILFPTNAGYDRESVCWEYHEYSRQILEGTLVNEAWFAFVCHLDACAACAKAGKWQPSDDCPNCDSWQVEGPHWRKAVPNVGVSVSWDYLREEVREAIAIPLQRNMIRRLNFCQWTDTLVVFITTEAWAACRSPLSAEAFLASLRGRECYLGVDMADKIDLASVVCIFPRPLVRPAFVVPPPGDDVSAESGAGKGDAPAINCAVDVLPFFWMPVQTLARRAQEDRIPYPEWAKDGYVQTTPGSLIDHDAIVEFIIADLATRFQVRGIGIDQAGAAAVVSKLKRQFGEEFAQEVPQGFRRLSEPTKLLEALVVSGNLTHDANPCEAWCIANMAIEENAWREIRPVKITQRKRIDGGVALIDGLERMIATSETNTPAEDPVLVTA